MNESGLKPSKSNIRHSRSSQMLRSMCVSKAIHMLPRGKLSNLPKLGLTSMDCWSVTCNPYRSFEASVVFDTFDQSIQFNSIIISTAYSFFGITAGHVLLWLHLFLSGCMQAVTLV